MITGFHLEGLTAGTLYRVQASLNSSFEPKVGRQFCTDQAPEPSILSVTPWPVMESTARVTVRVDDAADCDDGVFALRAVGRVDVVAVAAGCGE